MAAISYNSKGNLLSLLHRELCNTSLGHYTQKHLSFKTARRSKKIRKYYPKTRTFAAADNDYGLVEDDFTPDLPEEQYEEKMAQFLLELKNVNKRQIAEGTLHQSKSDIWIAERKKRLTASNFGKICKLRKTTNTAKTVSSILYSTFIGSIHTRFGLDSESAAIELFEDMYNVQVTRCGLIIDENNPFLACSPDGLVENNAVIEIKSSLKSGDNTPLQAGALKLFDYCEINKDENKLTLKKKHNYYYQVQGILEITGRQKCYFIVYTKGGIHVEEIERDKIFWHNQMEKKLKQFYYKSLLPELVDPRRCRSMDIRAVYMNEDCQKE
ncbi:uncharacterized protein LOC116168984 [Photinus pyralis]|uniref:uncharacterized protein LOC116168984 n=1 Tax=Photinus pyralis TaxID=7054 RepID=UPI0012673C29|nr:uncharacterized protein LOC116168984 [Photinus pyralis]